MKHLLFSFSLVGILSRGSTFGAVEDTQITDALNQKQQEELLQQTKTLNEKITFTQVNSCQSMESVFSDFLETYKKYYPERPRYYDDGFLGMEDMVVDKGANLSTAAEAPIVSEQSV
jgi:hypothetical protein